MREDQPVDRVFFQVQASDSDDKESQLLYSISNDTINLINIDRIKGELSLKTKVDYDDFKDSFYEITVLATKNNRNDLPMASAKVYITIQDANNKAPKFDQKEYKTKLIQGKTKPEDLVLRASASDSDRNALLDYSFVEDQMLVQDRNGNRFELDKLSDSTSKHLSISTAKLKKLFFIDRKTGDIELKEEPDYSFVASITLPIKVVDKNQEMNTSTGMNQEDFANCTFFHLQTQVVGSPFSASPWTLGREYFNISMLEELSIGTQIFFLHDQDSLTLRRVEKVFESDPENYFRVDQSGVISVGRRVDYEELPESKRITISVKAFAEDGSFADADINIQVIDVNDDAPEFKNQSHIVHVSEAVRYPQEILTVTAIDKDSAEFGQVYYSLSDLSYDLFDIDSRKGILTVKRGAQLDREAKASHYLLVIASDCDKTRVAVDQEHHLLHNRSITKSNYSICKESSVLVQIVLIDENDNSPEFLPTWGVTRIIYKNRAYAQTYDAVPVGSVIKQVVANDIDEGMNGKVSYEIERTDEPISRLLMIDQEGYISTSGSLLGMNHSDPYNITICAYDNGKSTKGYRQSNVILTLIIDNIPSNKGILKFMKPQLNEVVYLSEKNGLHSFSYQVQASIGENKRGLYYNFAQESSMFMIGSRTGLIRSNYRGYHFGRGSKLEYKLVIQVMGNGTPFPIYRTLVVKITDAKEDEPYTDLTFDDPPLNLFIEEEIPENTLVGTILAVDKDLRPYVSVGYAIIEGNANNTFRLDYGRRDTGNSDPNDSLGDNKCRIYSNSRLNRETKGEYHLKIRVSSTLVPEASTSFNERNFSKQSGSLDTNVLSIAIILFDINDNRPVFDNQDAKIAVDSTIEVDSLVTSFCAHDADAIGNRVAEYSILDALYYKGIKPESFFNSTDATYNYNSSIAKTPLTRIKNVFYIDETSGHMRNSVPLEAYADGYFEVFVKADFEPKKDDVSDWLFRRASNQNRENVDPPIYNSLSNNRRSGAWRSGECHITSIDMLQHENTTSGIYDDIQNCHASVIKVKVFVVNRKETFRLIFDRKKLDGRLDEFKERVENALGKVITALSDTQSDVPLSKNIDTESSPSKNIKKISINSFNLDREYEYGVCEYKSERRVREDYICSQLLEYVNEYLPPSKVYRAHRVISYDEVLNLFEILNATQVANQILTQYGLIDIGKCLPPTRFYGFEVLYFEC